MTTALIDTSTANLASVRFALQRLGADYVVAATPAAARGARRLILPGVGAAGPAMGHLTASGWAEALAGESRPLLGLCLGMQLLFAHSEEGDVPLLGRIPAAIQRLEPGAAGPWPHMGWNTLDTVASDEPLLAGVPVGAHVYFVHGYYAPAGSWSRATTTYGETITAVARSGNVAGCQFHPERSGAVGARILTNFLAQP
ncbi:MAG: imidazole glycerol phosphate synthase subunit HisH [Alphaproteobacteria bacterium]